jgi:ubiquinone biosynthesis protein
VVEGVARSLDPQINIWQVARPVVEDYIRREMGPRATLRDLGRTAMVLSRYGPRLPGLVEAALIRQAAPAPAPPPHRWRERALWVTGGVAAGAGAVLVGIALM